MLSVCLKFINLGYAKAIGSSKQVQFTGPKAKDHKGNMYFLSPLFGS
jgi:hypothetical protein